MSNEQKFEKQPAIIPRKRKFNLIEPIPEEQEQDIHCKRHKSTEPFESTTPTTRFRVQDPGSKHAGCKRTLSHQDLRPSPAKRVRWDWNDYLQQLHFQRIQRRKDHDLHLPSLSLLSSTPSPSFYCPTPMNAFLGHLHLSSLSRRKEKTLSMDAI